ncbi:hypothetical protein RUMTOR_01703 [[Ruminococcus] torques ATCC 27756]|uniref:Uncharacterized protein n=1 Tax=[Ruminococcus] torques ATCC 27756 TaxID=411460 RepID=A5KN80_9FIRM|nr:hypothetical protein RUMTOR_01703 [[Ruminococcus] torques ATCC 27756]
MGKGSSHKTESTAEREKNAQSGGTLIWRYDH